MTYLPVKARSEFQTRESAGSARLMKFSDGGVLETSEMFHAASCALNHPGLSPMRGSGLGGVSDIFAAPCCWGAPDAVVPLEAQAVSVIPANIVRPIAIDTARALGVRSFCMVGSRNQCEP